MSSLVKSKELLCSIARICGLGTGDAGSRGHHDDRVWADGDVWHDARPPAAFAVNALVRAGRCDPALIEAARGGDADALVSLISAAQPDTRRYAARNCRAADIDDAVQETMLLLYRRVVTLRAVTSFSAWLFAVARRACLRPLRRSIGNGRCACRRGGCTPRASAS
jgi:hypothetical protein